MARDLTSFTYDLAIDVLPLEDLMRAHDVSRETYDVLMGDPEYVERLDALRLELKGSGATVEAKARAILELNLPTMHSLINDPKIAGNAKVGMINLLTDMAGEKKKGVSSGGSTASGFVLNIHEGTNDTTKEEKKDFGIGDIGNG